LIEDTDRLTEINAPAGFDERASYENEHLDALEAFCAGDDRFHIVTVTTESDDAEAAEYHRIFPDWQTYSPEKREDLRELVPIFAVTASNCARTINRLNYFLATGDTDPAITVTEITSYAEDLTDLFWVCRCDGSRDRKDFLQPRKTTSCERCRTARPDA
jgi:hypothetical protein